MSTAPLGSTPSVSSADLHSICQIDDGCTLGRIFFQTLSFRELSLLAITSPAIRSVVEKYFSEIVESYKERPQVLPKKQEEAIFDSYLEEAIEEANRFLPATSTDIEKNKKICQVFSTILKRMYPEQTFSLPTKDALTRLSQIEKKRNDKALIEIMQMMFPADLSLTSPITTIIARHGLEEDFALITQTGYEKATFESVRALLDTIDPQIAINFSAKYPPEVLNGVPSIFLEREDFETKLGRFLDLIQWVHQVRAVSFILSAPVTAPATPESLAKDTTDKAKRLKDLLSERLFDSKFSSLELGERNISCLPSEFLRLTAGIVGVDLCNNSLTRVPPLSESVRFLSLSRNPLREFKNLSHHTGLTNLDLSYTGLARLPKELASLTQLEFLELQGNKLISLPRDLACPSVGFDDNPFIYIPPELLEKYPTFSHIASYMPKAMFYAEYLYEPVSALGKLYKYFVQPEENYRREEIKSLLSLVPQELRNKIYEWVWRKNERPRPDPMTEEVLLWGEAYAFDDLAVLARAVKETIEMSAALSSDKEQQLIAPFTSYTYFGNGYIHFNGKHFKIPLAARADVLSTTEDASFPQPRLFPPQQLTFVQECWDLHHQILSYLQNQEQATAMPIYFINMKCILRLKWEKLLETHRKIRETLPESTPMPSFITESFTRLEEVFPHSQTIDEIIAERHAIIPPGLRRDNYEGDFDLEVSYRPQSQLGYQIHSLLDLSLEPYRLNHFIKLGSFVGPVSDRFRQLVHTESPFLSDLESRAVNNPSLYAQALKMAVRDLFDSLSPDKRASVYARIHYLADSPATDDPDWGEHHAFDCWSRLADAITVVKEYASWLRYPVSEI